MSDIEETNEKISFSEKEEQAYWIGGLTVIGIIVLLLHGVGIL